MPEYRKVKLSDLSRRELMKMMGSSAIVSASAGFAGCTGGGGGGSGGGGGTGGGGGGKSEFQKEAGKIDFGKNYKKRRSASFDEWPMSKRKQIPSGDALFKSEGWIDTPSVKSAPWTPPPGWKDTIASDVDQIQILNYGDMKFDRATAAVDAMFEKKTGISMKRIQVVIDQAIPKMAAALGSGQKTPHMLHSTTDTSMSTYAKNGWLEPVDMIMPKDEMWDMYLPICNQTYHWNGKLWGGPANFEGNAIHVRKDLLKEQGLNDVLSKIQDGSWTWADLEKVMKAFKDTDVAGWAYRGSSLTYTERDFRVHWYQTGGQYIQDDGSIKVNGPGAKAALKRMRSWLEDGLVPDAVTSWGQGDLADGFLSGNLAMVPVATDLVTDAIEKYGKDKSKYIIAEPPKATTGPSPQKATWGGGPVSAINSHAPAKYKVAGTVFQDARFSESASWWEYVEEGNMCPAKATYDQAAEKNAVFMSSTRGDIMNAAKNETFSQQRAIMQKVSQELQLAISGDKSPKKALDDAQSFIDTVLSQ